MSEWWTYRPEDFLMFSERVYWRMFELNNEAWWPWTLAIVAAGWVVLALLYVRPRAHVRFIALILAVLWAFVGIAFVWQRFAPINFAMTWIAPLFAVEAVLLLVAGRMRDGMVFDRGQFDRWLSLAVLAAALFLPPFTAPISGRDFHAAELFGMAPDPTAIGTLGVLLAARGRLMRWLYVIPFAWCALSFATLLTMEAMEMFLPLLALVVVGGRLIWRQVDRTGN